MNSNACVIGKLAAGHPYYEAAHRKGFTDLVCKVDVILGVEIQRWINRWKTSRDFRWMGNTAVRRE